MFLYVAKRKRAWIGAVFQYSADAVAWWETLDEHVREVLEPLEQQGLEYPFIIIEWFADDGKTNSFEFLSLDDADETLTKIERDDSHPEGYCTVYLIEEDWRGHPTQPGHDYIGALHHWHVDNDWFAWTDKRGRPWRSA